VDRWLVVIMGLMGVGKTTVAEALSRVRGWPVLHSDAVRKELAGLTPTTPAVHAFGQGIYTGDFSRRTYQEMRRRAQELFKGGAAGVILDASYKSAMERELVRELAREAKAGAAFIWCYCSKEVVRARLLARQGDSRAISDGRLELLDRQIEDFEAFTQADQPLLRLDTGRDLAQVLRDIDKFLGGLPH